MADMKDKLERQEGQMKGLSHQVLEVSRMQQLVEEGVTKGIQEVVALQKSAATLEQQMNTSLQVETLLYDRQMELLDGHNTHEAMEAARATRVENHFESFEQFQGRMEDWQERYQTMQDHLLESSETLMSRSNDLQDTLIKLMDYEAKTEKAIRQVLGRSFKVHDLVVYLIGMVAGLSLGNMKKTQPAGGPVFAIFCVGFLMHRFLSDTWSQGSWLSTEGGWLSWMLWIVGPEFRVGWIIQLSCLLISAAVVTRTMMGTNMAVRFDSDQFYNLNKQLKKSERYIKALASQQKKMDEYIKKHMDTTPAFSNPHSPYRFASSNGQFQTAFQRHICNLAGPVDYNSKFRTSTDKERSLFDKDNA